MYKTKKWLALFLTMMLLFMVIGCGAEGTEGGSNGAEGSEGGSNSAEGTKEESNSDEEVPTVTMTVWGSGVAQHYVNMEKAFNETFDDVQLAIEMQGDYQPWVNARIAANDFPDMFFANPYSDVVNHAAAGRIMDLSNEPFADRILDSARSAVSYDGKIYGYPMANNFMGLFYNKDILESVGIMEPPKTFDALKEAVDILNENGIVPFAVTQQVMWTLEQNYSTIISSALGSEADEWLDSMNAKTGRFEGEWFDKATELFMLMQNNCNKNPMDTDYNAQITMFANGETAFMAQNDSSFSDTLAINPNLNAGIVPFNITNDEDKALLSTDPGIVVVVNANTPHYEAVQKVLEWFADDKNTDPNSWFNYMNSNCAYTPALKDIESKANLSLAGEQFSEYSSNGKTCPWLFCKYPTGFCYADSQSNLQALATGMMTVEEFAEAQTTAWYNNVK